MPLRLTVENLDRMPDGGPLSVEITGRRGLDIGRDQHLDWTLPDPGRTVSGKHCEVRYQDGGYWLYDVSTNGTYVNGSDRRIQGPHRLRDGDRLEIGHYLVAVALDGEGAAAAVPSASAGEPSGGDLWRVSGEVAPPLPRRDLAPVQDTRPVRPDFLEWAVEAPSGMPASPSAPPAHTGDDWSWAQSTPAAPPVYAPPPPVPQPRRPGQPRPPEPAAWDDVADPAVEVDPTLEPVDWSLPPVPGTSKPEVAPAAMVPPPAPMAAAPVTPIAPAAQPAAAPLAPAAGAPRGADFARRFAKGAGIPEEVVAWRDPGDLAEELGALMRIVAEDLKQLMAARAESKRLVRAADQTMIQALDNNPMKFAPTADDTLRLMFGRPGSGYLDAKTTLRHSFRDLKVHQVKTYGAMQQALSMLLADLEPQAIEEAGEGEKGIGGLLGSRKARFWDTYVVRWKAKTAPHDDGIVGTFMLHFSDCYDGGGRK